MEQVLEKFRAVSREPYQRITDWKRANRKRVIGCLPMYIPEEIIHAGGMLPITVLGDDEPITAANEYIQTNTCEVVRGTLDTAVRGRLDFLDGIVFSDICDPLQYLAGIWKVVHPYPYFHVLDIPHKLDRIGQAYLLTVWQKFRASLEKLSGSRITNESLRDSIVIYNQNRTLLRKLYDLRRASPGLISARDVAAVVSSGLVLPREEHNLWLTELLAQAEGQKGTDGGKIKLALAGNLCAKPHKGVLKLIEEIGGVVADDEIYVGARYFATEVAQRGDPLEALAEHYLTRMPCTTMHYPELFPQTAAAPERDYARHLIAMFERSGAQGLIVLMVLYCDPYGFKYPSFSEKLSAAEVPFLMIEIEHEMGSLETVRTRLQAFLEMLGG